jgi:sortase A
VLRKAFFSLGEALITLGIVVLLYVIYQLWFTNITADAATERLKTEIEVSFETETVMSGAQESVGEVPVSLELNEGFALAYIPKLKQDVWGEPILSGIQQEQLASGIGHYPQTELPGQSGNFAIAGHRATNGEPFAKFEDLKNGDLVIIRTAAGWYTYKLFEDRKIEETEVWVLDNKPIDTESNQLITLTTCDPRWNSYQRWAWWGELVDFSSPDQVPQEIAGF